MSATQKAFSLVQLFDSEDIPADVLKNKRRAVFLFEQEQFMVTALFKEGKGVPKVILSTIIFLGPTVMVDPADTVIIIPGLKTNHTNIIRKTQ